MCILEELVNCWHMKKIDDPFAIPTLKQFATKLPNSESRFNYLRQLVSRLETKHGLLPVFGGELEFYLLDSAITDKTLAFSLIEDLTKHLQTTVKLEMGNQQYEFDLPITSDTEHFINAANYYRNKISLYAKEHNKEALFLPKPFEDDYGSSLHIHLNFLDSSPDPFDVEFYANLLCNYMDKTREYFLPDLQSRRRLNHQYMAPTHNSWGGNNRSCMIRIPGSSPKRIEHRLCGADIDLTLPIYAILSTVIYGIENPDSVKVFPKIHGNAFDEQYRLEKI